MQKKLIGILWRNFSHVTCALWQMLAKFSCPLHHHQVGLAFLLILAFTSLITGIIFIVRDSSLVCRILKCNYSVAEFVVSLKNAKNQKYLRISSMCMGLGEQETSLKRDMEQELIPMTYLVDLP